MEDNVLPEKLRLTRQIFWFFICWFGGSIFGMLFMQTIASGLGIGDFQYLIEKIKAGEFLERINSVKIVSMAGHFATYTLSSLSFAYLIHKAAFPKYLILDKSPGILSIPLIIIAMAAVYPLALWVAYLNINMLPHHLVAEDTLQFEQKLMLMNSVGDLVFNLLLLGLIAGVGEELLFRGILQRFIAQYSKNLHIAVWGTAILFSMIHFQPEGFIPRFLLGALLGYLSVWTGSLWASILGHVSFNSIQVLLFYFLADADKSGSIYQKPDFSIGFTIFITGISIFVCFVLWKTNRKKALKPSEYSVIS
jgi:membrane protease YdiL (CAAX protease family)